MEYTKKERKNYNLYLLETKEFKTINVSFVFQRKNSPLDELYRTLLAEVLFLKTEKYGNIQELSKACSKIYAPNAYVKFRESATYRTFNLIGEFASGKYTEEGMNKADIEFIMDYFWHPFVKDGAFDKEIFDLCKKNYIERLKSAKNYPDGYSLDRFWRISNVSNFPLLSNEELIKELEKIDAKMLYEYYKSMFTEDSLDIFVAGTDLDEIATVIDNYIYGDFKPSVTIESKKHQSSDLKEVTEKTDNPQSKLLLGYKLFDLTKYEEKYTSLILSIILGGGTESCLHQKARTERSLCYYIYATCYNLFNVLIIFAGISASNTKEVTNIVKEEIEKIASGDLSEEKVNQVKNLYKNILLETKDSQSQIVNNLISVVLMGADGLDDRFKNVDKITKEDVCALAKKIKLDTVFLLEGTE